MTEQLPPLPKLPDHVAHVHSNGDFCADRQITVDPRIGWPVELFTADQLRSYAEQVRAAEREAAKTELAQAVSEARAQAYAEGYSEGAADALEEG